MMMMILSGAASRRGAKGAASFLTGSAPCPSSPVIMRLRLHLRQGLVALSSAATAAISSRQPTTASSSAFAATCMHLPRSYLHTSAALGHGNSASSGSTAPCHYETLSIKSSATRDEIKQAFRALTKKHHPDLHVTKDTQAQESNRLLYDRICSAYAVLSNPLDRRAYDSVRRSTTINGYNPQAQQPYRPPTYQYRETYDREHFESPYKIFSNTTIVWFSVIFMCVGAIVQFFSIKKTSTELGDYLNSLSRQASNDYEAVRIKAIQNGYKKQLQRLVSTVQDGDDGSSHGTAQPQVQVHRRHDVSGMARSSSVVSYEGLSGPAGPGAEDQGESEVDDADADGAAQRKGRRVSRSRRSGSAKASHNGTRLTPLQEIANLDLTALA